MCASAINASSAMGHKSILISTLSIIAVVTQMFSIVVSKLLAKSAVTVGIDLFNLVDLFAILVQVDITSHSLCCST